MTKKNDQDKSIIMFQQFTLVFLRKDKVTNHSSFMATLGIKIGKSFNVNFLRLRFFIMMKDTFSFLAQNWDIK